MEFFEQVKSTFRRMDTRVTRVEVQIDHITQQLGLLETEVSGLREDIQGIGGAFASIEDMVITNAAQMADLKQRVEALERRAS